MTKLDKSNGDNGQPDLPSGIKIDYRAVAYLREKVVPEIEEVLRFGGLDEETKKRVINVAGHRNCIVTFPNDFTIIVSNGPNDDPHESNGRH